MPEYRKVAATGDIPSGSARIVEIDDQSVLLTRVDDEYFAVDNVCSHDEGPLGEGSIEGYEVQCPRHEGRFDVRSGKATCFPAVWAINTYAVRVEGDAIEVSVKP